jgi:hypothetical protein
MRFVGRLAGIENVAAIVAGIAMVLAGLVLLGMSPAFKGWRGLANALAGAQARWSNLMSSPSAWSKLTLGLMMGFCPADLSMRRLMKALGEATPLGGALTMLAFGLGTIRRARRCRARLVGCHAQNRALGHHNLGNHGPRHGNPADCARIYGRQCHGRSTCTT